MHMFLDFPYSNGGTVLDPSTGTSTLDSQHTRETLQMYADILPYAEEGTTAWERDQMPERLGGVSITYGALPNGQRFCAALPGDMLVVEGESIGIAVNPSDCHVFDSAGKAMRRRMAPAPAA